MRSANRNLIRALFAMGWTNRRLADFFNLPITEIMTVTVGMRIVRRKRAGGSQTATNFIPTVCDIFEGKMNRRFEARIHGLD